MKSHAERAQNGQKTKLSDWYFSKIPCATENDKAL